MQLSSRHAAPGDDDIIPAVSRLSEQPPAKESVLFLQGPVGPFFSRIAEDFTQRGFSVHKINFNGGDKLFYQHANAVDYAGSSAQWSDYLQEFVKHKGISRIYVFGDCRCYHVEARKLARQLKIGFFVFEEGYIRPSYITLERDGVNGFSPLMNRHSLVEVHEREDNIELSSGRFAFLFSAIFAMMYYTAASVYKSRFPEYTHHRPFTCLSEGMLWIRSGYKKLLNFSSGKRIVKILETKFKNQYFLCPLQVHCDMQVLEHSQYESIDQFICEVISSFASNAPRDQALVFKHHPLDRGYTNYKALICEMARALHIDQRVYYVYDVGLPDLLRNAEGAVMINSTVGLSSLYHETPVKVMGKAIYDRHGMTFQGLLDDFWRKPGPVDVDYVASFRLSLVRSNQLKGNLYKRCKNGSASGVIWPAKLLTEHSPKPDSEIERIPNVTLVAGSDTTAANKGFRDKPADGYSKSA